jgi:hypothetical protein
MRHFALERVALLSLLGVFGTACSSDTAKAPGSIGEDAGAGGSGGTGGSSAVAGSKGSGGAARGGAGNGGVSAGGGTGGIGNGTGGGTPAGGADGGAGSPVDASSAGGAKEDGSTPDGSTIGDAGPPRSWAETFGAHGVLAVKSAVDAQGDVFVVGHFNGAIDFSSAGTPASCKLTGVAEDPSAPAGHSQDAFTVKLDPSGKCLWARVFAGHDNQEAYRIAIDSGGDAVVTGYFVNTTDFGGGAKILTSAGGEDVFVARLDGSDGHTVWVRRFGDAADQIGYGIGVDVNGNVHIAGDVAGTIDLAATSDTPVRPLTSAGGTDVFVADLDFATGDHIWSNIYGDAKEQHLRDLVRAANDLLIIGEFEQSIDFSGGVKALTSNGMKDVFAASLDRFNGNTVWSRSFGGLENDTGDGIATDSGQCFLNGTFRGTIDFGPGGGGQLDSAGEADLFTAALLSSDGSTRWAHRYGGDLGEEAGSVALDPVTGNVYTTGWFQHDINFGTGTMTSAGGEDWFLAELSKANGAGIASSRGGDATFQLGLGLATGNGFVVASGYYTGSIDFKNVPGGPKNTLTSPEGVTMFVAKFLK